MSIGIKLAEKGLVPDLFIKSGIRSLVRVRLDEIKGFNRVSMDAEGDFAEEMQKKPIAIHTTEANSQHYEVPSVFFKLSLGKRLKYSSCYYYGEEDLDQAELNMLELYGKRAELKDGMKILDLGCGWGSFTLWAAEKYPNSHITGVSNSSGQREYIMGQAKSKGLNNVQIITADMNHFTTQEKFDRIVTVEMMEHMRNYELLLGKMSDFLKDDGRLFVHIFTHKHTPYPFETEGEENWMGKYFFTGGIMPSRTLLGRFDKDFTIDQQWQVSGNHYQKTAMDWLRNTDKNQQEILDVFADTYGTSEARIWLNRWRIFFLSCAEMFGYRNGEEWGVTHYLLRKK